MNIFDQPLAQDLLGLPRDQFKRDPRGVVSTALTFDTRKTVEQRQAGLVIDHRLDRSLAKRSSCFYRAPILR